jgi:hypothetical protein
LTNKSGRMQGHDPLRSIVLTGTYIMAGRDAALRAAHQLGRSSCPFSRRFGLPQTR